jgi:hypothetical protein
MDSYPLFNSGNKPFSAALDIRNMVTVAEFTIGGNDFPPWEDIWGITSCFS